MLEFIQKFWLETLFTAALAVLGALVKKIYARIEKEVTEQAHIKGGVLSLLHDRLYQACVYHMEQKRISLDDLNNLEYMYRGYRDLGGNGVCEELFNRVKKLPIAAKEDVS